MSKKSFFILPFVTILLIGTGCLNRSTTQQENKTETTEISTNEKENSVVKSDDGQIEVEIKTEEKTEEKTEDGVPVVDILLGSADVKVEMETGNFFLNPNTITATPGQKIKLTFAKNSGFHTFVIKEINLKQTIKQDESLIFTAPENAGSYEFFCDVGSHRALGMKGTLIVQ